mgnify:CR=1 FL=1
MNYRLWLFDVAFLAFHQAERTGSEPIRAVIFIISTL